MQQQREEPRRHARTGILEITAVSYVILVGGLWVTAILAFAFTTDTWPTDLMSIAGLLTPSALIICALKRQAHAPRDTTPGTNRNSGT